MFNYPTTAFCFAYPALSASPRDNTGTGSGVSVVLVSDDYPSTCYRLMVHYVRNRGFRRLRVLHVTLVRHSKTTKGGFEASLSLVRVGSIMVYRPHVTVYNTSMFNEYNRKITLDDTISNACGYVV